MDGTQQVSLQVAASFKAFLMKSSSKSNLNLYDHLSRLLMRVIEERPHDVVDVMEDLSHDVKLRLYEDTQSTLQDLQQTTAAEELAEQQKVLFVRPEDAPEHEFELESALPNVSEIAYFLEQAGVGLGREEMQRVFLALKQLVSSYTMQRCRLWGKILGTERSYIIAEAEFTEGEEEDDDAAEEAADDEAREVDAKEKAESEVDRRRRRPLSRYGPTPPVHVQSSPRGSQGGQRNRSQQVCVLRVQRAGPAVVQAPVGDPGPDHRGPPDPQVLHGPAGRPHRQLPALPRQRGQLPSGADRAHLGRHADQPAGLLPGHRGGRRRGGRLLRGRHRGEPRVRGRPRRRAGGLLVLLGASHAAHPASGPLHLGEFGREDGGRVQRGRGRGDRRGTRRARARSGTPAAHAALPGRRNLRDGSVELQPVVHAHLAARRRRDALQLLAGGVRVRLRKEV
ncbi:uncharacterized protein rsph4a isoform X2 [Phycodurus eques]|uniref:uncharacterized protein rsph4a isoform X2 n=1 Tax=Phycodurus eques TaxID=693459 RepID=UPI002ACE2F60|nr:uncharacterized protein rsph4a isoform X2 [Phycodurus eques]